MVFWRVKADTTEEPVAVPAAEEVLEAPAAEPALQVLVAEEAPVEISNTAAPEAEETASEPPTMTKVLSQKTQITFARIHSILHHQRNNKWSNSKRNTMNIWVHQIQRSTANCVCGHVSARAQLHLQLKKALANV